MARKAIPIILILIGAAFALGALFSMLDNLTATEPAGLGTWIFDILQFLVGAAGTGLGVWLNLGKKESGKTSVSNTGEVVQSVVGDHARQVQTGGGTYFENVDKVEIHGQT